MQCRAGSRFLGLVLGVLASQAGCDNTPNPNFEQSVTDAQSAQRGDPYSDLNNLPRQDNYLRAAPELRAAFAGQQALSLRATYESLLHKLDGQLKVPGIDELVAQCRAAFAAASSFQEDQHVAPENAKLGGTSVFQSLTACRDRADKAVEQGNSAAVKEAASTLRRFASYGTVIVGVATISHGDESAGLELWRRGQELAMRDRPGFKITPNMFR